jgi:hypothetical protein
MGWIDCRPGHRLSGCPALVAAMTAAVAALQLAACSVAGPRRSPLPQDGPTLVEVYREHIATEGTGAPRTAGAAEGCPAQAAPPGCAVRGAEDPDAPGDAGAHVPVRWSAGGSAPLDALRQGFARLPNPDLVMYVFPHLARGRYPVPGYYTVFPMYESAPYALPGEMPRGLQRSAPAPAAAASSPADPGPDPMPYAGWGG